MAQTQMEQCWETIINIFHRYSIRVGHFDMLSKGELKQLIEKELPHWLKDQNDPKAIEKVFQKIDKNKDKDVDFAEFMDFITEVTIAAHKHIHKEHHDHDHDDDHHHHH